MFPVNWLWDFLVQLGLVRKTATILVLGVNEAGINTLMHIFQYNEFASFQSNLYPAFNEFTVANIRFSAHSLGQHGADYYSYINGIVFVVDSADPESFSEAKAQLDDLLSVEEISKLPFLILGNKIDAPGAVSRDELKRCLGLHHITEDAVLLCDARPIKLSMCSVVRRQGYIEGFDWISRYV